MSQKSITIKKRRPRKRRRRRKAYYMLLSVSYTLCQHSVSNLLFSVAFSTQRPSVHVWSSSDFQISIEFALVTDVTIVFDGNTTNCIISNKYFITVSVFDSPCTCDAGNRVAISLLSFIFECIWFLCILGRRYTKSIFYIGFWSF